jgi:hypothetical protein
MTKKIKCLETSFRAISEKGLIHFSQFSSRSCDGSIHHNDEKGCSKRRLHAIVPSIRVHSLAVQIEALDTITMSHWMTSGRSRLKAKQKRSFSQRAQQRASLGSVEAVLLPAAPSDSSDRAEFHPRRRRRSHLGKFSSFAKASDVSTLCTPGVVFLRSRLPLILDAIWIGGSETLPDSIETNGRIDGDRW